MKSNFSKKLVLFVCVLLVLYFSSRLINLTALPVFADEAIYIRWAQLIMDNWRQYLFFSLNDGKTPLFIWLMLPFQYVIANPLIAGRMVSVLVGLAQVWVMLRLAKAWRFSVRAQMLVALLVVILPIWQFHQRIALMDGLMTLLLSYSLLCLTESLMPRISTKIKWVKLFFATLFYGLALWTKLPAVLFAPVLALAALTNQPIKKSDLLRQLFYTGLVIIGGMIWFFSLKLHPAFSQLFTRGGDFLFSPMAVLTGEWRFVLGQIPRYIDELTSYLTPLVLIAPILGLVFKSNRRIHLVNIILIGAYLLPIIVLGRVVYARYFLPTAVFFTLSTGLLIDQLISLAQKQTVLWKRLVWGLAGAVFIANIVGVACVWQYQALFDINALGLSSKDRTQYLEEWSAGQGIREVTDLLLKSSQNQRVVLATEGYFGTLPDGILMYLHRLPVDNLFVMGVGQPVRQLPAEFIARAQSSDQAWLVVNSHRMKMALAPELKIAEYCRPNAAPCLELWDVKKFTEQNNTQTPEKF